MKINVVLAFLLMPPLFAADRNPFLGRWDFNLGNAGASWLGVVEMNGENNGQTEVWYQAPTGNVSPLKDFKIQGTHLSAVVATGSGKAAITWELDAVDGRLIGFEKRGEQSIPLTGIRAPDLKRPEPNAWTAPQPLFNGKDLAGWEPVGDIANNHWHAQDGLLINEAHGANLKTTRQFDDFKVHFEVNCPDGGNSGFYLRGRYEVQLEYEPLSKNPPERRIGSIYGRLAPVPELPRTPSVWESFDVTLVGRVVTVIHNGKTVIDHKEIEGITGGALDANEGRPGPLYIQGDHTGGLKFRNITVSTPKP